MSTKGLFATDSWLLLHLICHGNLSNELDRNSSRKKMNGSSEAAYFGFFLLLCKEALRQFLNKLVNKLLWWVGPLLLPFNPTRTCCYSMFQQLHTYTYWKKSRPLGLKNNYRFQRCTAATWPLGRSLSSPCVTSTRQLMADAIQLLHNIALVINFTFTRCHYQDQYFRRKVT